ncbi:hypothetical protein [Psychrobacter sp. I-STPA10]|uniref:hypothetical protein n=1 Tax=Psychrobacter sp. I-STPA10 TaxID=2585769 RepID=UPI001E519C57|nr:hypothetical protein [Psychrobacter sp. I-STPA10]
MSKIDSINVDDLWQNDLDKYLFIENIIQERFIELLHELGQDIDDWVIPFFNTFYGNGEKMMDANPIFSAKNKSKNYIIRVIIYEENSMGFSTYASDFDGIPMSTIWITPKHMDKIEDFFIQAIK